MISSDQLSSDQTFALKILRDFSTKGYQKTRPFMTLGGYAGTGKTTVIRCLIEQLEDLGLRVAVIAFTGKAASVLRKKGVTQAQTMHSLMYKPILDKDGNLIGFRKKSTLLMNDEDEDSQPDVVVVDEASMVDVELNKDLLSFNIPVIYVGDPGQLPPVGDSPNLLARCDFVLERIHRQAQNSPIIQFSLDVRRNNWDEWGYGQHKHFEDSFVSIIDKKNPMNQEGIDSLLQQADQVIVPFNRDRIALNDKIRLQKNMTGLVSPGERIICLENNRNKGVFNGQQLLVDEVLKPDKIGELRVKARDDLGKRYYLSILEAGFSGGKTKDIKYNRREVCVFDYAYVITCHKSQGSEWDSVLVIETYAPPSLWEMRRWQYTAITRAAKELYYVR